MALPLLAVGAGLTLAGGLLGGGNDTFQLPAAPTFDPSGMLNRADLDAFIKATREQTLQRISQNGEDFRTRLASQGVVRSGEAEERFFRDIQNPQLANLDATSAQAFIDFSQLQSNVALSRFNTEAGIFNTQARIQFSDFERRQGNDASLAQGLGQLGGVVAGAGTTGGF